MRCMGNAMVLKKEKRMDLILVIRPGLPGAINVDKLKRTCYQAYLAGKEHDNSTDAAFMTYKGDIRHKPDIVSIKTANAAVFQILGWGNSDDIVSFVCDAEFAWVKPDCILRTISRTNDDYGTNYKTLTLVMDFKNIPILLQYCKKKGIKVSLSRLYYEIW